MNFISYMDVVTYRSFFKAFSNKTRLQILALLRQGSKNVSQLCAETGLEQSRVSHNLRCLLRCGFVDVQPNGKERVYSVDSENIVPILNAIDKHIKRYEKRLEECMVIR